jgi:hypothetical protein
MSFQAKADTTIESQIPSIIAASGFEKHILQCCKQPEWVLRAWVKKVLARAGFTEFYEDGYLSDRVKKDSRYKSVHNLLAIRGHNANICLAAHTDICRDHSEDRSDNDKYGKYGQMDYWMYNREPSEKDMPRTPRQVEPWIKTVEMGGVIRRIIQDRECRLQVGGDDRLGVAIITWIALNTGYDMGLYFPTDEEIGLRSASACKMERLKAFELIAQVDRGNHTDELVNKIGGDHLADYDTTVRALTVAYNLGMPRTIVNGAGTDVAALKRNGYAKQAFNMTCGYHNSVSTQPNEYIDLEEATNTMWFVAGLVKDYNLNGPFINLPVEETEVEETEEENAKPTQN